jgi:hypothetical protein
MGRPHKDVTVVIALNDRGEKIREDIVPNSSFERSGSLLLNSAPTRIQEGIRMISVRVFDVEGQRLKSELKYFSRVGLQVEALHRRPDGSIIEPVEVK